MNKIILQILSPIVISAIVGQIDQFGKDTDWTKLKIAIDGKVREFLPGKALDDVAVKFVNRQVDNVQAALRDKVEMEKVLELLAQGEWTAATEEIIRHAFPELKGVKLS